ncbi:MarR family winged helix-turn-helix transcriptional regulator [Peterkaempfera bronchialis]|nr:MarR family transcriptional regulator [Peterkaempfera bronchialis]
MTRKRVLAELSEELKAITLLRRQLDRPVSPGTKAGVAMLGVLNRHGEMRVVELAEHLCLDMSVVSRQLAHIEQLGLAVRRPNPTDGRSCLVSPTDAGREVVAEVSRTHVRQLADATATWDRADLDALAALLGRLRQELAHAPLRPTAALRGEVEGADALPQTAPR